MLLRLRGTYGHRAADAQRLPHEQLRAGPHEHLLGGAHHHHARGLHSQDSGGFEHGGGFPAKGGGVERLSGVVNWAFRHRNVGEAGARPLPGGPEKAESLIGCGGQCAERGQTIRLRSPTSLRHDCLPPAIAPTPTPNTPQTHPQTCPTTRTTTLAAMRWSPSPSSSSLVSFFAPPHS
jgi:hypothetical protein